MNFAFSEEQEELRTAVRRFLTEKSPETEVRRLMDTTEGYDPAVWSQMADQLGLQSLTIPEEFGGSGFTYVELTRRARGDGRRPAVRAVLLHRSPWPPTRCSPRATTTAKKSYLPGPRRRARRSPRWPSPRTTASGTSAAIECEADEEGRRLGARRPQDVRDRRPRGQPDRRRGPHAAGRVPVRRAG